MKAKTIIIVLLTALVTIVLMKNMDEVDFWIFGVYSVPKLAVMGTMFVLGILVGLLISRKKKKPAVSENGTWQDPPMEVNNGPDDENARANAEYLR